MKHIEARSEQPSAPLYRAQGFFLLRAPALPADLFSTLTQEAQTLHDMAEGGSEDDYQAALRHGYATIRELVTHSPFLQTALSVASADIENGITHIQQHGADIPKRARRAYARLLRYLIRMSTRPTPFGLFAGVALGTFADHTRLTLADQSLHRLRLRPDMGWLLSLIEQLELNPDLLPDLSLMVNSTATVIGSRVILPDDQFEEQTPRSISFQHLPIIQVVMEKARQPLPYADLVRTLREAFPALNEAQIHALLRQLWQIHFLVSPLRPPLTHPEPTRFVLQQLSTLPAQEALRNDLERLLTRISAINQQGIDSFTIHDIEDVSSFQKTIVAHYPHLPFQVDATLHVLSPSVHHEIADEAAKAAEILLRIGASPQGLHALHHYRAAFLKKYGAREVPLLELLSAEGGLGAPSTYFRPPRAYPLPEDNSLPHDHRRDRALATLLSQALHTQSQEVRLTDAHIQELAQWTPTPENPPPSLLEVFLQIEAASREDIDRGTWGALVIQGITFGGRAVGRFVDLLGEPAHRQLQAYLRAEEALFPDIIFADLNYLPIQGRCGNVCARPALRSYEIAVHTLPGHAAEQVILLDDLVVGVEHQRFYVRSVRLGKQVRVTQSAMLNTRFASNICRFLLDIAWDGCPYPGGFDWGVLSQVPFLPRLTYGKCVLSLAQWNLRASDIVPTGGGSDERRWFLGLQQWRKRWRVPRHVLLSHLDQRLLLDLEHPLLVQDLQREVQTCQPGTSLLLQEMLPDLHHLWLHDTHQAGYVAELVVPLLLNQRVQQAEGVRTAEAPDSHKVQPQRVSVTERCAFPGDRWVYLKWYASPTVHNALITRSLRAMVAYVREEQLCDQWFYLRYADPEPHLRLRFHTGYDQVKDPLLLRLLDWSRQLAQGGDILRVCLDTYEREIERYGGPLVIDEIERLFSVNSDATSALVAAHYSRQLSFDPLITAVFSLDHFLDAWGWSFPARLEYARSRTQPYESIEAFRTFRTILPELLVPWRVGSHDPIRYYREQITAILAQEEPVIRAVVARLHAVAQQGDLWRKEEHIVGDLLHLHVNRLLGTAREQEQKVYALWRHTLECVNKRPQKPSPMA